MGVPDVSLRLRQARGPAAKRESKFFRLASEAERCEVVQEDAAIWHVGSLSSYAKREPIFVHPLQSLRGFPGESKLTHKGNLATALLRAKSSDREAYDFFPDTWVLPRDATKCRATLAKNPSRWYISKPTGKARGNGIAILEGSRGKRLTSEDCVVQRYIEDPYLLDGFKFDLRLYVLLTSVSPSPTAYLHKSGLVRFCTTPYPQELDTDLDRCAYLTNYAVNKRSADFDKSGADGEGSKWSLKALWERFAATGVSVQPLLGEIRRLVGLTVASVAKELKSDYKMRFGRRDVDGGLCFDLLGFDVMFDQSLKP